MSDDEEVASDVSPWYLFLCLSMKKERITGGEIYQPRGEGEEEKKKKKKEEIWKERQKVSLRGGS